MLCNPERMADPLPGCSLPQLSLTALEVNFCQIKLCFLWDPISSKKHVKSDVDSGVLSCLIEWQELGSYTGILDYKAEFILRGVCVCVNMHFSDPSIPRESPRSSSKEDRHTIYKAPTMCLGYSIQEKLHIRLSLLANRAALPVWKPLPPITAKAPLGSPRPL